MLDGLLRERGQLWKMALGVIRSIDLWSIFDMVWDQYCNLRVFMHPSKRSSEAVNVRIE